MISKNDDVKLTKREAYDAMIAFLEIYYNLSPTNEIGGLLGAMAINECDGMPMDIAMWQDWDEAISQVKQTHVEGSSVHD